jgi:VWFA-related protein
VPARFAVAALLGAAIVATAAAQQVYVTLCTIHFVVTDRNGRFVKDLGPTDFTIYDNDRAQEIATLAQRVQVPVSLVVILDRSQSLSDTFANVVNSAAAFVTSSLRREEDRGALVAFDSHVYLLQDWTADAGALVGHMRRLTAAGGSSIFDAVAKTCRDRFDPADTRQKVVVLVTDGEDTTSTATFDEALQSARLARVAVYVLAVRAENSLNSRELQGRRVLARLAELTGGRLFYPVDYRAASLPALFADVQEELRNGYNATYYLDVPPDNTFHRIRIDVKNRSLNVHAPAGYEARRPQQTE